MTEPDQYAVYGDRGQLCRRSSLGPLPATGSMAESPAVLKRIETCFIGCCEGFQIFD